MVAAVTLAQYLASCAPDIGPRTMGAIVTVESGGNPLAINDNTSHRQFAPRDRSQAIAYAKYLIAHRHSVDLGIAQINNANFVRLGLSIPAAFDPCTNLRAASQILSYNYSQATEMFGSGQYALRRAISAYNSGSMFAGRDYIVRILLAAGIDPNADMHVPDIVGPTHSVAPVMLAPAVAAPPRFVPLPIARTTPAPAVRVRRPAPRSAPNVAPAISPILVRVDRAVFATPSPAASDPNAPLVLTVNNRAASPAPIRP